MGENLPTIHGFGYAFESSKPKLSISFPLIVHNPNKKVYRRILGQGCIEPLIQSHAPAEFHGERASG